MKTGPPKRDRTCSGLLMRSTWRSSNSGIACAALSRTEGDEYNPDWRAGSSVSEAAAL
jgi:hypothetical protein